MIEGSENQLFVGVTGLAAFVLLLMVFVLYINKKLCISYGSCCDEVFSVRPTAAKHHGAPARVTEYSDSEEDGPRIPLETRVIADIEYDGHQDLISLAEKGKVGGGSSSESSCSTASSRDVTNQDVSVNMSLPQEQLYDVTDLNEQENILKCGHLEVAFAYDAPTRKMTVRVLQARDVPNRERGGPQNSQVRLLLLPSKRQKHKTKIRQGENPQFVESFLLHRVNPEDVNSMGVRFRVYTCERMRRERMMGECVVGFSCINLELETTMWLMLEPRANIQLNTSASDLLSLARSDSTGSTHSMQHGGVTELLVGLAYNGTTGRLAVEIVKGSHFSQNLAMSRAPDTYVKLCLVSSTGNEMARSKTSIRRGQPNPLFKETFMFQVALFQLPDVTMLISVYSKRSMKRKEMIGWFSLGQNGSGDEEIAHWNDMRDLRGEQICRWHVLVES